MPSASRTARDLARVELTRAILDSAREQLREVGPAALSVRAVARDVGMVSSAVYRYFPSRDSLLTALLVEAYDDLGEAVERAHAAAAGSPPAVRWRVACHALRDWARDQPHRYALAYGSPVPGYVAPADTVAPAGRVATVLLGIVGRVTADRPAADRGPGPGSPAVSDAEARSVEPVGRLLDPPLPPAETARLLGAWATLLGHVSLELFGHLENAVLDLDVHFAHLLDLLVADLGLPEG
ncbi:TetR/AcrR family transcriptional regulator [uncultured Nocardioides sp.]|uniref:TetR/AcrR family transcriptional regulator n=1 Tax=uncultured Nocardioides sp. TaxID=198441 RepID=UPI00262F0988|nr:TetR/AcrR family transcriptional regulator [uncultured Nocardioides sp.]